MSTELPHVPPQELARELRRRAPEKLSDETVTALAAVYRELARWAPRLALIGPGTAGEVLDRHFGESLAALPLLPPPGKGVKTLLDLGSGAGFPGLVLAAARSDLAVVLTEPRERKWAFLKTAVRKAALPCRCLNARVDLPLPSGLPDALDVVTMRALQVPPEVLDALARRMGPESRFLLWVGDEAPAPPAGWKMRRSVPLRGSERRRIVEWRRAEEVDGSASEPNPITPEAERSHGS